jgi:hypothetical protein
MTACSLIRKGEHRTWRSAERSACARGKWHRFSAQCFVGSHHIPQPLPSDLQQLRFPLSANTVAVRGIRSGQRFSKQLTGLDKISLLVA